MRVEFAFLCDAATEAGGKLYALGIGIEQLQVAQLPARPNRLTLVSRIEFDPEDAGAKAFSVRIVDADGRVTAGPVDGSLQLRVPPAMTRAKANLLIDMVQPEFRSHGPHEVTLAIDGEALVVLPLEVRPAG